MAPGSFCPGLNLLNAKGEKIKNQKHVLGPETELDRQHDMRDRQTSRQDPLISSLHVTALVSLIRLVSSCLLCKPFF